MPNPAAIWRHPRARFYARVLRFSFGRVSAVVGAVVLILGLAGITVSLVIGASPWITGALVFLTVWAVMESGYKLSLEAGEPGAYPWDELLDRAEGVEALIETQQVAARERPGAPVPRLDEFSAEAKTQFRVVWANWRRGLMRAYDKAAAAGHPVGVERESLRSPEPAELPGIARAFEDAGRAWEKSEGQDA